MKKSSPPPGFISGPHMHDPRDPAVYYPAKAVKKALRKRAKPNPTKPKLDSFYRQHFNRWAKENRVSGLTRKAMWRLFVSDPDYWGQSDKGWPAVERAVRMTNPAKRGKRRKNSGWYIHVQKSGCGPVLLWNGRSFASPQTQRPIPFTSQNAAMYKARHLLGKFHRQLSAYKIWVSDQFYGIPAPSRRVNPSSRKLDEAARKLEDFTGHEASQVLRVPARSEEKTGLVIGEMDQIDYRAARDGVEGGKLVRYRHKFRKGSRPLLAVSTDGKQLHVVGGQYEFTEAGIEDR